MRRRRSLKATTGLSRDEFSEALERLHLFIDFQNLFKGKVAFLERVAELETRIEKLENRPNGLSGWQQRMSDRVHALEIAVGAVEMEMWKRPEPYVVAPTPPPPSRDAGHWNLLAAKVATILDRLTKIESKLP